MVAWATVRSPPLTATQVAVIGAGAIGLAVTSALTRSSVPGVTVVSRRAVSRLELEREGVVRRLPVRIITGPPLRPEPVDWLFLAVKAYQTEGAGDWIRCLCNERTTLVVLQNGIRQREVVAPYAGRATVLPAAVWIGASVVAAGRVRVEAGPRTLVVPAGPAGNALAGLLGGSWIQVETVADFCSEAWRKLCYNAVASLSALTGTGPAMFGSQPMRGLAGRLAAECVTVARADGARLPDDMAARLIDDLAAAPPEHQSSILRDRRAGRPVEWRERNDVIRDIGARHGIPTPVSDVIVPLLAAAGDPAAD